MSATSPKKTLAACSGAHVLHDGLTDLLYVLLPLLAQAFGLSYAQVGLVRSANKAALAAFQLPAGLAAERIGTRNLLAAGTAIAGIAFLALGAAGGFAAIVTALFVAGIGSSVQHPLSSALISHAYPGDGRRMALGTYNFAGDLGKVSFAALASALFAAGIGWQPTVTGLGAVALAAAAGVLLLVPADARRAGAAGGRADRTASRGGWGIRDRRGFAALCAIETIDSGTRAAFLTFIAFLMIARGIPDAWAVVAMPLVAVGGMAGKLACGYLAERVGVIRTIAITEVATGAGIVAVLTVPPVVAYCLLPLIGVALSGTSSALYGSIGDLVEPDRVARAFGLFYTLGSTCGVAAPLLFGVAGDLVGMQATMGIIAATVFLTLPLCLALKPALARVAALKPA
jgi:MFS family permease